MTLVKKKSGKSEQSKLNPLGFLQGCLSELAKVRWPSRSEVVKGTVVVVVTSFILTMFLWGVDEVLQRLFNAFLK
jgi:preprotein translocase SecE subunit